MALAPGARLGPYEITAPIGAGGMGEVYRARDSSLGRDVAIKVLLETVAHDPERLARFAREARTLAALSHPNIAHIHGLEKNDGTTALVMELVEGPTLADRLEAGPIPLHDASPDASRFLRLKLKAGDSADNGAPRSVIVVQNWTEELTRLVPTN
jgi:serine/threonine protein kinase